MNLDQVAEILTLHGLYQKRTHNEYIFRHTGIWYLDANDDPANGFVQVSNSRDSLSIFAIGRFRSKLYKEDWSTESVTQLLETLFKEIDYENRRSDRIT